MDTHKIYKIYKIYKDKKEIGLADSINYPKPNWLIGTQLENWDVAIYEFKELIQYGFKYIIVFNRISLIDPLRLDIYYTKELPDLDYSI